MADENENENATTQEEERDVSLDALIENSEWIRAHELFVAYPEEARRIFRPSTPLSRTKLHWLCSIGSSPPSLIDLVASLYPEAVRLPDGLYGDTPLHIIGRNSQTSAEKVRILLRVLRRCDPDCDGLLVRNQFGGTALHSAANHNATLDVLRELVRCRSDRRILTVKTHEGIHAVSALWHSYIQTIPGSMIVARILESKPDGNPLAAASEGHFDRFWKKAEFLAAEYYAATTTPRRQQQNDDDEGDDNDNSSKFVLHGLLQCNVAINFFKVALLRHPSSSRIMAGAPDGGSNLPLHRLLEDRPYRLKEREALQAVLRVYPGAASYRNAAGDLPLLIALRNKIPWHHGIDLVVEADARETFRRRDPATGLYPFQLAAAVGGKGALDATYRLLAKQPELLSSGQQQQP